MTCYQLHATFFGSKRCPGGNTQAPPQTVQAVHLNEGRTPFCTVSSQKINKQTNTVSRSSSSQTMLEGLCGCFKPCNVFLAGNSEVSLVLQCFTAELITYIVCECDAPECWHGQLHWQGRQHPGKYQTRQFIDTRLLYPLQNVQAVPPKV